MGIGGKVCVDLSFFPFLFSPYLWYSVDDNVGVHSVSGPNSFSLVPPPALGSPPVCLQSAVCCEGEAGNSLGSAVTVVQSRKPSWRRRDRQGLFVRILYIDF